MGKGGRGKGKGGRRAGDDKRVAGFDEVRRRNEEFDREAENAKLAARRGKAKLSLEYLKVRTDVVLFSVTENS